MANLHQPRAMLAYVSRRQGHCWERKLRLFTCACLPGAGRPFPTTGRKWRKRWSGLPRGNPPRRRCARRLLECDSRWKSRLFGGGSNVALVGEAVESPLIHTIYRLGWGGRAAAPSASAHVEAERAADLLRDVLGPFPFRTFRMHGPWLTWQRGIVPAIAQEISEERAFGRLPILADALEDSGCCDPEILAHCRSQGPHVLGAGPWTWCCAGREAKHRARAASFSFSSSRATVTSPSRATFPP